MIIKILGSGCSNCAKLASHAQDAVDMLNLEATIKKVTDMQEIMAYNILRTPAMVVDGKVLFSGQVLSAEKIAELLSQ